jgi:hypothetical protein
LGAWWGSNRPAGGFVEVLVLVLIREVMAAWVGW